MIIDKTAINYHHIQYVFVCEMRRKRSEKGANNNKNNTTTIMMTMRNITRHLYIIIISRQYFGFKQQGALFLFSCLFMCLFNNNIMKGKKNFFFVFTSNSIHLFPFDDQFIVYQKCLLKAFYCKRTHTDTGHKNYTCKMLEGELQRSNHAITTTTTEHSHRFLIFLRLLCFIICVHIPSGCLK